MVTFHYLFRKNLSPRHSFPQNMNFMFFPSEQTKFQQPINLEIFLGKKTQNPKNSAKKNHKSQNLHFLKP